MNPLQNQLLDKLHKQNEQAGFDTSADMTPPVQPTIPLVENVNKPPIPSQPVQPTKPSQPVQPMRPAQPVQPTKPAQPLRPIEPTRSETESQLQPEPEPETLTGIDVRPMASKDHIGETYPAHSGAVVQLDHQEEIPVEPRNARIAALERALEGQTTSEKSVTPKAATYLDDFGAETYYVKNISNGHVSVSDIDLTVKRGKSEDLLKFAALEDIKKSRDLRAAVGYDKKSGPYSQTLLLRLTPEEYEIEKIKELQNKQKIDQFKQNQANIYAHQQTQQQQQTQTYNAITQQKIAQPQTPRIRPTVLSKLEKLRLSSVPENAHLGLAPEEFVEWAITENLSLEELDFIISHPNVINNSNIRTALYEKRSEIT
jgi:hypothetical protein